MLWFLHGNFTSGLFTQWEANPWICWWRLHSPFFHLQILFLSFPFTVSLPPCYVGWVLPLHYSNPFEIIKTFHPCPITLKANLILIWKPTLCTSGNDEMLFNVWGKRMCWLGKKLRTNYLARVSDGNNFFFACTAEQDKQVGAGKLIMNAIFCKGNIFKWVRDSLLKHCKQVERPVIRAH